MGSSGSTPSRSERPITVGIVVVGDDHARACTGRRLIRLGLARAVGPSAWAARKPVVLDPYASVPLTAADRERAQAAGLVAVDCSWNRLSSDHASHRLRGGEPAGVRRRLPMLLAANPQHFGRVGQLNTAEAIAAALFLLGAPEQGRSVILGFAGGGTFLELNQDRLARYSVAQEPTELVHLERALFAGR